MMRIISGYLKGRKLSNLNINILRPTQARVRKSIMDSIRVFNNKSILDLFAGVGTLGIESLSREAKEVKFVEKNSRIISILNKNLDMLNLSDKSIVVKSDVIKFLKNESEKYDIIFADPPYYKYEFEILLPLVSNIMKSQGIFCYESNKQNIECIKNMKIKHYGNTQVVLWKKI